ncbi:hypothetical protein AX16_001654 [Volvariella volvacea WC 439]|nr:hypothetical protein AX16_001654 [Volvariella volvacea WC 439]
MSTWYISTFLSALDGPRFIFIFLRRRCASSLVPLRTMPYLLTRDDPDSAPSQGLDIVSEIGCYALPYGLLGFLSHLFTYYTLVCLWYGRRPMLPWQRLSAKTWIILLKDFISLGVTAGLAGATISKCKGAWQFEALAVWKLTMTLLNGVTSLHASGIIIAEKIDQEPSIVTQDRLGRLPRWCLFYIPGMIAGMAGTLSLVSQNTHIGFVKVLTGIFSALVVLGVLIAIAYGYGRRDPMMAYPAEAIKPLGRSIIVGVGTFTVLSAFYSDWVLGAMTDNLFGMPVEQNAARFWAYYIAKRLPMFSW